MRNKIFSTKGTEIEIEAFHPCSFLLEEIEFHQIQKKDFAKLIGLSINNLNHIFAEERDTSTTLATKIGNALGASSELWYNMQSDFNFQQTTLKMDHA
ncbi:hypothetical protein [Pedobacter nototheniae]|uniref:helix-turn-helix transcriptional regulator n=1 Tax=Pedobacter nototheniae TaxID=2488994 RepID=UPI0029319E53|nr:hypothetical protein [Pedobacter nototheniae]